MKSTLDPYDNILFNKACCRFLNPKQAATGAAYYTINMSMTMVCMYLLKLSDDYHQNYAALGDVYYGVVIAYFAIIGSQLFMVVLSLILLFGISKENLSLVTPWIIGNITFMAFDALCMVYSNVLRDHVNKGFDDFFLSEVGFYIVKVLLNIVAISVVMKFCNYLRAGITWKGPEIIEL